MKIPNKRTKVVATIGPASSKIEVLEQMIYAGVNVCRINSSHGDVAAKKEIIENIRFLNKKHKLHIAILIDLQGPKIRIGEVQENGIDLHPGQMIELSTIPQIGTDKTLFINYTNFPNDVKAGDRILLDDGKLELIVNRTDNASSVHATVIAGGLLTSKKGVNLPNTKVSLPSLTEKDLVDLQFAIDEKVDWIGLSFVRSPEDVKILKQKIAAAGGTSKVIAKIEKPEAIDNIDEIIAETDGLMVARGDLGVEVDMAQVPYLQKMIVKKCIYASKPVIIATQMMESMITNHAPTRAEVTDVANAVIEGADAVMLSGETSVGQYPIRVVEWMTKIVQNAEKDDSVYDKDDRPPLNTNPKTFKSKVIIYNACKMAKHIDAKAIITMTHSGYSAFKLSSYRPKSAIYVFTDNEFLLGHISLLWGVHAFFYNKYHSTDDTIAELKTFLKEHSYVEAGDVVINIASMPLQDKGRTNMLKISNIE